MNGIKVLDTEMHKILAPWEGERYQVVHNTFTREQLMDYAARAAMSFSGSYGYGAHAVNRPGTVAVLYDKHMGEVVMSDTRWELRTNLEFIRNANGKVLVGGLGIGFTLLNIQDKPEVTEVTVVEKDPEIIAHMTAHLPLNEKVWVVQGDILEFRPEKGERYDTVWFDIWNSVSWENHRDMKLLHRRWSRYLNRDNPRRWMGSWEKWKVYKDARS